MFFFKNINNYQLAIKSFAKTSKLVFENYDDICL
jgi:hypothetical protein